MLKVKTDVVQICILGEMHRPVGEQCRNQHKLGLAEVHGGLLKICKMIGWVGLISVDSNRLAISVNPSCSALKLRHNCVLQVNIIGVMTGTEIALERMKKVLGNVQETRMKYFCQKILLV